MTFKCPRGHLHLEGAAFCTVCGAGPVLESNKRLAYVDAQGNPHFFKP